VLVYPAWIWVLVSVSGGYGDTTFHGYVLIFFLKNKNNNKIGSYMQQGP
jgi:hypothetical protein